MHLNAHLAASKMFWTIYSQKMILVEYKLWLQGREEPQLSSCIYEHDPEKWNQCAFYYQTM